LPIIGYATQYFATGNIGEVSAFGFPVFLGAGYQFIWGYSLLNYFFAVTICVVVKEGLFLRFLDWKPMQYLGKISYGLYVYHFPVYWFASNVRDLGLSASATRALTALITFGHLAECLRKLLSAGKAYPEPQRPLLFTQAL
jgi:peptidoglycan/LPS O-acetylase OafA/YrhL